MAAISSWRLSSCGSTLSPPPNPGSNSIHPPQNSTATRRRHRITWTQDSSELVDDGFSWRKYGDNSLSLCLFLFRGYYRCTHKYDQGCQATKQVQRIQGHLPIYRTTYVAHHTCKSQSNIDIMTDSSIYLNFNNDLNGGGSYIATANSKNYSGDIQTVPYSNYNEGAEEESVMGPAYESAMSPESELGKDLRLSQPSLSSHLPAATFTSSPSTSQTSSPSSPSLHFDDVFCFRP